jgi:ectoine hydroxylase-related dioxygenase (phytanoyl-CoA dioxygenase family)
LIKITDYVIYLDINTMLTAEHIQSFNEKGYVVIEDVLNEKEIDEARHQLHTQLLAMGLDQNAILSGQSEASGGPRLKGQPSKIFYNKWKLDLQLNSRVYECFQLGINMGMITHMDRICWRLPDHIRAEGGLGLHLDRNPVDPYLLKAKGLQRFRPIQGFLALTDHCGSESGGLRVVSGFHKQIDHYFNQNNEVEVGVDGEFFRIHSKKYTSLQNQSEPVYAPRGALVLWDNRLPHATCEKLTGFDTREVVYMSFIPNIEINRKYCQQQFLALKLNQVPPKYVSNHGNEKVDRNFEINELNQAQLHMLGEA